MNRLQDIKHLFFWFIKLFRPRRTVYLVIKPNFIKVYNFENGKTISKSANQRFSSNRLIIADPIQAELLAKKLLRELYSTSEINTRRLHILLHPIADDMDEFSLAEKMMFNDFILQVGAQSGKIITSQKELSAEELKPTPNNK